MIACVINELKGKVTGPMYGMGEESAVAENIKTRIPPIVAFLDDKKFLVGDYATYIDFFFFELLNVL